MSARPGSPAVLGELPGLVAGGVWGGVGIGAVGGGGGVWPEAVNALSIIRYTFASGCAPSIFSPLINSAGVASTPRASPTFIEALIAVSSCFTMQAFKESAFKF